MNWSAKSNGFSANTERRNFRRVVVAVALLGLAALSRAAYSCECAPADPGFAVSAHYAAVARTHA